MEYNRIVDCARTPLIWASRFPVHLLAQVDGLSFCVVLWYNRYADKIDQSVLGGMVRAPAPILLCVFVI